MKIGLNLWIWSSPFHAPRDLALFEKVKGCGADVVEFAIEDDSEIDLPSVRRTLRDVGLECSVLGLFGAARDLSSNDPAVRRNGVIHAFRCLDQAAAMGAAILSGAVIGVGGDTTLTPTRRRDRLDAAADGLREIGEYSAQAGVRFCFEVLNRYESNLINTAAEACELLDITSHSNVGMHLDCFHMNIEERGIGAAIRQAGSRLFHLHGSESDRGTPGMGHLDWTDARNALLQIGYDGFVVVESFDPYGRLASLARFWRPFPESSDELARRGVSFLQQTLRATPESGPLTTVSPDRNQCSAAR